MSNESAFVTNADDNKENVSQDVFKIYIEGFDEKNEYKKKEINKYFKNLYEFCNINFLFGSGYCAEKLKTLSDLELLIETNSKQHINNQNMKKSIEALILYDFFRNSIYPHKEDIVTKTSFGNSNRFITQLVSFINSRNDKNLLKRVNIFTTNYDMYFELSLEANNTYYNDGFAGKLAPVFSTNNYNRIVKQIVQNTERESQIPTINLYKLHGSLAWTKSVHEIEFNSLPSDFLTNIEKNGAVFEDSSFLYKKSDGFKVNEAIDSINMLELDFNPDVLSQVDKFLDQYNKLYIINPTKRKFEETLLSNVYYDLLRMYSNELEKNNSILFVFGFSFKDEHIYSITKRALSNPSMVMYIFIYNEKELMGFKSLFEDKNNVFFVYCLNKSMDLKEFNSLMFGE